MILDADRQHEAWTNWARPDEVHAFGCEMGYDRTFNRTRQVARCQIMVRVKLDEPFNPDDAKACPDCAEGYRRGLSMTDTVGLRTARRDPATTSIICTRGMISG
jgi:hypothetical protein